MTNLTYAQLCVLADAEQIREERLAIMIHDGGLTESEAVAIIKQRQRELFGE